MLKVRFGGPPKPTREPRVLPGIIGHYFALDHPLAKICDSFPKDPVMNAARNFCHGLRIIRQPKWECLATFICSSMKQVAHIRQISMALRKRFGEQRRIRQSARVHVRFATASCASFGEGVARLQAWLPRQKSARDGAARQLRPSGSRGLVRVVDVELRKQLCELPGVGPKIANCVMLFAYERLRAFPIDVWIERVLRQHYFSRRRKITPQRLREFSETYFGEHGGYAQQYLFHHARMSPRGDCRPRGHPERAERSRRTP